MFILCFCLIQVQDAADPRLLAPLIVLDQVEVDLEAQDQTDLALEAVLEVHQIASVRDQIDLAREAVLEVHQIALAQETTGTVT